MTKNKSKLFIENILVYGIGGIISKIIPLVMVPFVTYIMPGTSYFGISDLSSTLVSFGSAFAVMGMYDAMFRYFFDRKDVEYKKLVCSTALRFTLFSSFVVFIIMVTAQRLISHLFFGNAKYTYIVVISAFSVLVGATNSIISAPTRMQNKRRIYLITNTLGPVVSYLFAVPLLLKGYYITALPLATLISTVFLEISFFMLNRKWFSLKKCDWGLLRKLLCLAVPLMPNFLIYWIYNSCDKLMITNIIGVEAAGIYAVSSKLGHASQLIYMAFAGGWQYFAFSTMKDKNQVESNSFIFEILGVISFAATMFVCALSYWIFKVLFKADYLMGYISAPYLFLSPLLLMLYQVIANQFLIIKKPWPSAFVLFCGAVVNIVMNVVLIPLTGIEGAAIATLLGYFVAVLVCSIILIKMGLLVIKKRFLVAVLILAVYVTVWRTMFVSQIGTGCCMAFIGSFFIIMLYKRELTDIIEKLTNKNKKVN